MARKRDDTVKLVLRLPPQLHRRLTRIAIRKNQSLNSEMVQRLEKSLAADADELERVRLLRESHFRLREDLTAIPAERLNALTERLDKLIAALEEPEDDGEKK